MLARKSSVVFTCFQPIALALFAWQPELSLIWKPLCRSRFLVIEMARVCRSLNAMWLSISSTVNEVRVIRRSQSDESLPDGFRDLVQGLFSIDIEVYFISCFSSALWVTAYEVNRIIYKLAAVWTMNETCCRVVQKRYNIPTYLPRYWHLATCWGYLVKLAIPSTIMRLILFSTQTASRSGWVTRTCPYERYTYLRIH